MKILIVEDSKTQAERLKLVLEQDGHVVYSAANGHDALSELHKVSPDLIISDIIMPEMDGYELCKRARQTPRYKNIPIILLTTLSETEDIVTGLESGANHIITKPYIDEHLQSYVKSIMEVSKLRENDGDDDHVKILVNKHEHLITSKKSQILDLLVSTYDAAVQKNKELYDARLKLQELNTILEHKVQERTAALMVASEERKQFEKQFIESQKMESIGQLAGGIAHDFNNLLMVMQCNVEMLKPVLKDDEKNIKLVNEALSAMKRGADLIKRLMVFSRRQQLQPEVINLRDLISNAIQLLRPMMGTAIDIHAILPKGDWSVYLDPNQLENALVNLSVNARDAMKRQGTLTIELSEVALDEIISIKKYNVIPGHYVKISVSDNGEGIPANVVDHVFEPFFTTKEVGKGTGLGLSMVYGFIKQSMGHITIYSEVGHGTTINLYLPKAYDTQLRKTKAPIEEVTDITGNETILVVEDEASLREVTAGYLASLGYKVFQAENGAAALAILQAEKGIHLLLSDVIMPGGLLGTELVDIAQEIVPDIKVIYVSGYPKNVLLSEKTINNPDMPLLVKPYSMSDLGKLIKTVMQSERSKDKQSD